MAMNPREVYSRLQWYLRFIGIGGGGNLYKGRVLHLKGRFFDEKGAIAYYQKARPRTRDAMAQEAKRVEQYYMESIAQEKESGHAMTRQRAEEMNKAARSFWELCISSVLLGRIDAAYWLGLIEYELGQYDSASSYFGTDLAGRRFDGLLGIRHRTTTWPAATKSRAIGRNAVQEYEAIGGLYKEPGSLLRAKWLRELHIPTPAAEAAKASVKKPPEKNATEGKTGGNKADGKKAVEKKPEAQKSDAKKPGDKGDVKKPDDKSPAK